MSNSKVWALIDRAALQILGREQGSSSPTVKLVLSSAILLGIASPFFGSGVLPSPQRLKSAKNDMGSGEPNSQALPTEEAFIHFEPHNRFPRNGNDWQRAQRISARPSPSNADRSVNSQKPKEPMVVRDHSVSSYERTAVGARDSAQEAAAKTNFDYFWGGGILGVLSGIEKPDRLSRESQGSETFFAPASETVSESELSNSVTSARHAGLAAASKRSESSSRDAFESYFDAEAFSDEYGTRPARNSSQPSSTPSSKPDAPHHMRLATWGEHNHSHTRSSGSDPSKPQSNTKSLRDKKLEIETTEFMVVSDLLAYYESLGCLDKQVVVWAAENAEKQWHAESNPEDAPFSWISRMIKDYGPAILNLDVELTDSQVSGYTWICQILLEKDMTDLCEEYEAYQAHEQAINEPHKPQHKKVQPNHQTP